MVLTTTVMKFSLSSITAATVEESQTCVADEEQLRIFTNNNPARGMPYGFPAITAQEESTVSQWILKGTPDPLQKLKLKPGHQL